MKPLEVKGARARLGLKQQDVAEKLNMSVHSYAKKESGSVKFSDEEKISLANLFGWNMVQINDFLFDGKLPLGNEQKPVE